MKKIAAVYCMLFLFWFISYSEEIKVGYADEELFPYAMGDGDIQPEPPGIYIEIINRAAKELGITIKYQRLPTKRAQEFLKVGEINGYFSLSYTKERLELGSYPMKNGNIDGTRRLGTLSYYLYKLEKSPVDYDGKTIKNAKMAIGANLGYSIIADIKKMGFSVEEAKTIDLNLKKLQADRICAFAGQDVATDEHIKTGKYGNIVKIPIPLTSKDYFFMFSNQYMEKHSESAEKFWTKIGELRDKMTAELAVKYIELQQ